MAEKGTLYSQLRHEQTGACGEDSVFRLQEDLARPRGSERDAGTEEDAYAKR